MEMQERVQWSIAHRHLMKRLQIDHRIPDDVTQLPRSFLAASSMNRGTTA
jgi:hypothetical protein